MKKLLFFLIVIVLLSLTCCVEDSIKWENVSYKFITFDVCSDWAFDSQQYGDYYNIVQVSSPEEGGSFLCVAEGNVLHSIEESYKSDIEFYEEFDLKSVTRTIINEKKTTINDLSALECIQIVDWQEYSHEIYTIYVSKSARVYQFDFYIFDSEPSNFDEIYEHVKNSIK